jgi:signal peptidase I
MGVRKCSSRERYVAFGSLLAILLTVLSLAALRHWRYDGLTRPFLIHGSSMAPALKGGHLSQRCRDCAFPFHVAVDLLSDPQRLTCPNCGYRENPLEESQRTGGERVWIDRWKRSFNRLERWDMVAFHHRFGEESNREGSKLAVKRIIGLPGEQIELRGGEIYANGTVVRKSMEQFRAMGILLFDTYYRPSLTKEIPDRFQPVGSRSHWKRLATGYQFDAPQGTASKSRPRVSSELDQLLYHHWACMPDQVPRKARTAASPVADHYCYNHGLSRGQLLSVSDLLFKCSLTSRGRGILAVSLFSGADRFEIWLDLDAKKYELRRGRDTVVSAQFHQGLKPKPLELEFAIVDHQVIFVVNGRTWLRQPFVPADTTKTATLTEINAEHPLMIAAQGLEIQIHRMQLYRDIYWAGPFHHGEKWQTKRHLQQNEYFLVGDNVPVSEDCRHWGEGILSKAILGKVLLNKR